MRINDEENNDDEDVDDDKFFTLPARTASSKSASPGSAARPRARLASRLVLSTGLRNRVRTFSTHEKSKNKNLRPDFF
jgi:hypothetical protein